MTEARSAYGFFAHDVDAFCLRHNALSRIWFGSNPSFARVRLA
jgi:hypothetical protein